MLISVAPAEFRPVSVTLETEDEFDIFVAILSAVAENRVNHTPTVIRAAVDMRRDFLSAVDNVSAN